MASRETTSFSSLWGLYHSLSASDPHSQAHPGAPCLSRACQDPCCPTLPTPSESSACSSTLVVQSRTRDRDTSQGPFFPEDHRHSSASQRVDKYYPRCIAEHPERPTLLVYSLGSLGKAWGAASLCWPTKTIPIRPSRETECR